MRGKSERRPVGDALRAAMRGAITSASRRIAQGDSVHETRRTLKLLYSLMVVARPAIGDSAYRRAAETLRGVSKALAEARRADAMDEMAMKMLKLAKPRAETEAIAAFRAAVAKRAGQAEPAAQVPPEDLKAALAQLRRDVTGWPLPASDPTLLFDGAARAYEQAHRRIRKGLDGGDWATLHSGRKALINHLHHLTFFRKLGVDIVDERLARLEKLRGALGDLNDLADAEDLLAEKKDPIVAKDIARTLSLVIARRRRLLLKKAAKLAAKLLKQKPRVFTKQIRVAWDASLTPLKLFERFDKKISR